jgi:hypothetical protein
MSGTTRPTLGLPNCLEKYPTSHGRHAPPKFDNVNITDPAREAAAPNSRDKSEIAMG